MLMNSTEIPWGKAKAYLAHALCEAALFREIGTPLLSLGNLHIALPPEEVIIFAQDIWHGLNILSIASIGEAVKRLKAIQPFWVPYPVHYARRTQLIAEQLPMLKKLQALTFPLPKLPPIGAFTLLDEHTLLYTTQRKSSVPDGAFCFVEDKKNPPNRAYLKLWEALSLLGRYPKSGDFAIDFGACPGGWTYVLQNFGARVLAVDKSPLEPKIARLPNVEVQQASAFSLTPKDFAAIDWFVCDVACYPERLYQWLMPWIESGKVKQFIVTIKLQGETDFAILRQFQAIPKSKVVHLFHNKHEVTLLLPGQ